MAPCHAVRPARLKTRGKNTRCSRMSNKSKIQGMRFIVDWIASKGLGVVLKVVGGIALLNPPKVPVQLNAES